MRTRLLLGGLAAALALTAVPAQAAESRVYCADGFEAVCYVIALTCVITGERPCHP